MSETFFQQVSRLDGAIAAGPGSCDYERDLGQLLRDDALREYFFRHLADPAWLEVLVKAGQFRDAPPPEENASEKTIGFPFWPQGEYLKKIAPLRPDRVSQVVAGLPTTQNARVHDCILDIALAVVAVSGQDAVGLVPKAIEGVRCPYHLTLPLKIGSFISALANAGLASSALQLAATALEVVDQPSAKTDISDESALGNLREPAAHFVT